MPSSSKLGPDSIHDLEACKADGLLVIHIVEPGLARAPTINTSVPVTARSKLSELPIQSSHHKTMPAIRIIKEERVAQVGNAGMRKVKQEATKGGRAMKVKEDPEVDWEFQM